MAGVTVAEIFPSTAIGVPLLSRQDRKALDENSSSQSDRAPHPLDHAADPVTGTVNDDFSVVDDYLDSINAREEVDVVDNVVKFDKRARFEATRERARRLHGNVVGVVTNDEGELLLVENAWMNGYGIPGGGVEPGEDWESAARREVSEGTGVTVELDRPLVVYGSVSEYDDDRFRGPFTVEYQAHPVGSCEVADDPGVTEDEIEAVGWFGAMPDRTNIPGALRNTFERFVKDA